MVVVDPMCNFASAKANLWVPIRVGTDAALALAMVDCLLNELGIYDREYLKAKTNAPYLVRPDGTHARQAASGKPLVWDLARGSTKAYDDPRAEDPALAGRYEVGGEVCRPAFELLKEHVRRYSPERAEEITGVDGLLTPGTWMLPHLPYPPAEPRHPDSRPTS